MAGKSGLIWGFCGGLIVGLLGVSGCHDGGVTGPAVESEPDAVDAHAAVPPHETAPAELAQEAEPVERGAEEGVAAVPQGQEEGGAGESEAAVELALRFVAGQVATYKVSTESYKSVEWVGSPSARPAGFKDGRRGNHVEMILNQRVQEVRDDGNATLEVTIEALKYAGDFRDNVVLDFDSTRSGEQNASLAVLVGKSYTVRISPKGRVLAVGDLEPLQQAVMAVPGGRNAAMKLIAEDEIRERHTVVPLAILKEDAVRPGQSWSDVKMFSFGDMGPKSFERVYTLKQVRQEGGPVAVVEMQAIPPATGADASGQPNMGPMMWDSASEYAGRLELDLDSGGVREYGEEMRTEWAIADPGTMRDSGGLAALRMAVTWLHRVELVP